MARILVIEDDPHQRQLYTTLLYYNGFDTDEASSAEAGIAAARQNRPDAVLVDVRLPGMNGLQLANLLKQTPATAQIPIICFSAYDMPASLVSKAGADDFLKKPVSGDVLVRSIRKLIGWQDRPRQQTTSARALVIAPGDSATASSVIEMLQSEGWGISRATDGASGIGVAATIRPDFIVVHLHTPVLDAQSVLRRLKGEPKTRAIPVFAISDAAAEQDEQQLLQLGFAGVLRASDRAAMLQVLRDILRRRTGNQAKSG